MKSSFFAMLFRMKYIDRWALMRNTTKENLSEHSLETAFVAHALAVIRNKRFGGKVNPERAALLAMFHDTSEIITGDLPTPVKYHNEQIKSAYKEMENEAGERILNLMSPDLREEYTPLFTACDDDKELWQLCKAADKICALIKCIEERNMGNKEFASAEKASLNAIKVMDIPEANVFLEEFIPAFELTLDEQA